MYTFYILCDQLYIHVDKDKNIVFTYLVVDYMYTFYILEDPLRVHVIHHQVGKDNVLVLVNMDIKWIL
jgi:hypothetical protein